VNDRAAISALVLEAMGDAWSDSEEYSALPGVVADLLLMSDWLATKRAKWQAEALRDAAVTFVYDMDPFVGYQRFDVHAWLCDRADRIEEQA